MWQKLRRLLLRTVQGPNLGMAEIISHRWAKAKGPQNIKGECILRYSIANGEALKRDYTTTEFIHGGFCPFRGSCEC